MRWNEASARPRPRTASTEAGAGLQSPLLILFAALIGRVALALTISLAPDELYYLSWSRQLAAGYTDHPPAVAWCIALGTWLFGETPLGIRLPALLLGGVGIPLAVLWLGREAGLERRSLRLLTVAILAQPLAIAAGLIITPDVPFLLFWILACAAAIRAVRTGRLTSWLVTGACFGGALLSKHSAWLLPVSLFLGVILQSEYRAQLRRPGPWLGLLFGLLLANPNLLWDASRGFPSLGFQLHHGLGPNELWRGPLRLLELIGGQIGLLTPLVALGAILFLARGHRGPPPSRMLWVLALVPLAVFAVASLLAPAEANWPAPSHPALLVGCLLWLGPVETWSRRRRNLVIGALLMSVALSLVAVVHLLAPLPGFPPAREPATRLRGWQDHPDWSALEQAQIIWTDDYELAAALTFHHPDNPDIRLHNPQNPLQTGALCLAADQGSTAPTAPEWCRADGTRPLRRGLHIMHRRDGEPVRTIALFSLEPSGFTQKP